MAAQCRRADQVLAGESSSSLPITPRVMGGPAYLTSPTWDLLPYRIYKLCLEDRSDEAIDLLFDRVDDLLLEGRMDEVDRLLEQVKLERLNEDLLVAFLTITAAAWDKLPAREKYREKMRRLMVERKGEAYTAELLSQLT